MSSQSPADAAWAALDPDRARALTDARLQLHHAAQFASALGISYLPARPDDRHTTLRWDTGRGALVSAAVDGVTMALDVTALALHVDGPRAARAAIALNGRAIDDAAAEIRHVLGTTGLDPGRYTLQRHFELPAHPVADGGSFDASDRDGFHELARWFGDGARAVGEGARRHGGSPVVCWPHHFDVATLVTVAPGRSTGAGLVPGDGYYPEPYFYVNAYPAPVATDLERYAIAGGGHWHTHEWVGAVLPGSALVREAGRQPEQVREFLESALQATMAILRA